jgi:cardiolipin synthase A/B
MPASRVRPAVVLVAALLLLGGCARVHPRLALPEMALGEPSFFPTIEAYTAAPIVGGNSVEVLLNGEQIFPAMLEAVRGAVRTIAYAQFHWEDGPVASELAEAIAERCRAGVGANVLLDAVGASGTPAAHVDVMKRAGCHVVFFRPVTRPIVGRASNRNHRRILVVDGRVGFTGGSGVSRRWMGNGRIANHWRDTDVRLEGPVVEYLQGAFAENWLEATGVVLGGAAYFPPPLPPRGPVYAQIVRSSPAGGSFGMYTTFLLAIASAQHSIHITNPHLAPDDAIGEELVSAARRGVRVVVLVPGAVDHDIVRPANRRQFRRMLRAGVEIYEYRAALLHAKTMVVDGVWSTVGSANLDDRSFALNDELNAVIYNAAVARRFEAVFREDLEYSQKMEYRDWRRARTAP